jgi:ABC-type phosphate transport system substrate-binding protein
VKKKPSNTKITLDINRTYGILAYDAVVVIVNRQSKDSVFTIAQLKDILREK